MANSPDRTLAVDLMGSDRGPAELMRGVELFLTERDKAAVLLVGATAAIDPLLGSLPAALAGRVERVHADQEIAMADTARHALRSKTDSSMHRSLELVRDGRAAACVSCGNTAALMAVSRKIIKPLAAVRRPAIVSAIPAIGGHTFMLDLGANSDCSAEQLYEFAVMGECVARQAAGIEAPKVGLLNIGQEASKGTPTIREAADRLADTELNYVGFVEGHDICLGDVDVVVSDGFVGNVALKTMEGMARMLRHYLSRGISEAGSDTLASAESLLDPRLRNGATLVGLNHVVVKSHGSADHIAFAQALRTAWQEIRGDIPAVIERRFADLAQHDQE